VRIPLAAGYSTTALVEKAKAAGPRAANQG
jgi:hypothetical protein